MNYRIQQRATKMTKPRPFIPSQYLKMDKLSASHWHQNGIDLKIHFSTLTKTVVEVNLIYSFIDTIGSLGALTGMFFGASLMTVVELVSLIVSILSDTY